MNRSSRLTLLLVLAFVLTVLSAQAVSASSRSPEEPCMLFENGRGGN